MIEGNKSERFITSNILDKTSISRYSNEVQAKLMQALGYEADVAFARSLFCDRLAYEYKLCKYISIN